MHVFLARLESSIPRHEEKKYWNRSDELIIDPATETPPHTSKEDFCRDCHLGLLIWWVIYLWQGECEKTVIKVECVSGVPHSLLWALRDSVKGSAREVAWPASIVRNEGEICLEQWPLLIAMKWTKCFSQGDQQLRTIHLFYKRNRRRWTSPSL